MVNGHADYRNISFQFQDFQLYCISQWLCTLIYKHIYVFDLFMCLQSSLGDGESEGYATLRFSRFGLSCFGLADSVRAVSVMGHFGLTDSVMGHFGLTISMWGHFTHNISVHKHLITLGRGHVILAGVVPTPI